jgi:very-short-patch-repair endonuclease
MKRQYVNLARNLRSQEPPAERLLWNHLNAKQLDGLKFRRQHTIGNYIIDFVCPAKMLIIEIDGGHHNELITENADTQRTKALKALGYQVIRFWNNDVLQNIDGVVFKIRECLSLAD